MRGILPGRPQAKLQAVAHGFWEGIQIIVRQSYPKTHARLRLKFFLARHTYPAMRSSSSTVPTTSCKPSTSTRNSNSKQSHSMKEQASLRPARHDTYIFTSHTDKMRAPSRCVQRRHGSYNCADARSGRCKAACPFPILTTR
jgi:hypothetical protein